MDCKKVSLITDQLSGEIMCSYCGALTIRDRTSKIKKDLEVKYNGKNMQRHMY